MQRLCDDCHGVYKNKASFEAHQNKTGHRQNAQTNLEDSGKLDTQIASLQDSIMAKDSEIASLKDFVKANNNEIISLQNSLKAKESNIAILHDEIAELSSLEHEQDIVRNTLHKLTQQTYDAIGLELGFKPKPEDKPATTAPVADVAPVVEPEPTMAMGKKDDPGWKYYPVLNISIRE